MALRQPLHCPKFVRFFVNWTPVFQLYPVFMLNEVHSLACQLCQLGYLSYQ